MRPRVEEVVEQYGSTNLLELLRLKVEHQLYVQYLDPSERRSRPTRVVLLNRNRAPDQGRVRTSEQVTPKISGHPVVVQCADVAAAERVGPETGQDELRRTEV